MVKDRNQHSEPLAVHMRGDAPGVRLVALHVGFVGPPTSKPGDLWTGLAHAPHDLRAEAGDRGMVGHAPGDDEEVGLLTDRANLVGKPLERAGLDLALEPLAEWLAECARDEGRARFRECLERGAEVEVRVEDTHAHAAWWSLLAHADVEG